MNALKFGVGIAIGVELSYRKFFAIPTPTDDPERWLYSGLVDAPLSRAEHRSIGRIRLAYLFERSEFPRDPFD